MLALLISLLKANLGDEITLKYNLATNSKPRFIFLGLAEYYFRPRPVRYVITCSFSQTFVKIYSKIQLETYNIIWSTNIKRENVHSYNTTEGNSFWSAQFGILQWNNSYLGNKFITNCPIWRNNFIYILIGLDKIICVRKSLKNHILNPWLIGPAFYLEPFYRFCLLLMCRRALFR